MSDEDEGLLARWSRRKREGKEAAPVPNEEPAPEEEQQEAEEALSDEEILEKLGLPDPDTLGEGSDFRAFLAKHVPEHLRRRALRRLWTSNPVLANVDGLVDYGGDFTDAATVPKVLETAYRVGKGYLKQIAEMPDPSEAEDEITEQEPVEIAAAPEAESLEFEPEDADIDTPDLPADIANDDDPEPPRPRRMTFRTA